jgi:predicted RNA-binding Zn-ribbon protein involved in translation (DUF1610 family)
MLAKPKTAKRNLHRECHQCQRPIMKGEQYTKHRSSIAGVSYYHEECPEDPQKSALIIYGDVDQLDDFAKTIDRIVVKNRVMFGSINRTNDRLNWNHGTCYDCNMVIQVGPRPVHCPKCGREVAAT